MATRNPAPVRTPGRSRRAWTPRSRCGCPPRSRSTVIVGARFYNPYYFYRPYYYDPWYYSSFSLWYGPGYGFYGGYPYYGQYPYGRYYDLSSSLRLQVTPREAEVYIDGYYAGTVDNFDGVFQRLNIAPGEHEILVYLDGYRSFTQRFYLQPGKSFTIRHTMEPLGPGEAAPPRPQTAPVQGRAGGPRYDDREPVGPPDARAAGSGRGAGGGRGRQGGPAAAEGFGSLSLRVQPPDAQVLIDASGIRIHVQDEKEIDVVIAAVRKANGKLVSVQPVRQSRSPSGCPSQSAWPSKSEYSLQ